MWRLFNSWKAFDPHVTPATRLSSNQIIWYEGSNKVNKDRHIAWRIYDLQKLDAIHDWPLWKTNFFHSYIHSFMMGI
jgi:hypothetical protein